MARHGEDGDFVNQPYTSEWHARAGKAHYTLTREGGVYQPDGKKPVLLTKTVRTQSLEQWIDIEYKIENRGNADLHTRFGVEFNVNLLAGDAHDRYVHVADHELEGAGIDMTGAGGRLDVHVDSDFVEERRVHRRLQVVVFLNSAWRDEWGGQLELWDGRVKKRHHAIAPMLNRCVIFKTTRTSYHGVAPVTAPPNVVRKSFAGYYYTAAPPASWDGVGHGTVFRARPGERMRDWFTMQLAEIREQIDAGRKRVERIARRLLRPRV